MWSPPSKESQERRLYVVAAIQRISVPSQGHCGFPVSGLLTDFVCLLIYEF